ncbi:viral IAP-associated factor homolog [Leguminivora glycinivorella]|uniref:viral IAP-associated factor homolog n=1 Tax=Leguminivora glycinivorella TaxID=1035111 RepID=UPI00200DE641|nr:viral IAP-associated factor homolog [Leguminivora glycinivorella]
MQNPNEDTEWNDVLRAKGIIPQKEKEVTEDDIVNMIEQTIQQKQQEKDKQLSELDLDGLDELEDSEDEAVLEEYRKKRIAELKRLAEKPKFGDVREVSGQDYVQEVNKAGEGIWVVIHLYKQGIQQCALLNQHLRELAAKYPYTKFLKAIAQTCIPNFPERNLPSVFVYFEGDMKKQFVGPHELRGTGITCDELEYILGQVGAVDTKIKEDPRPKIKDKLFQDLGSNDW